MIDGGNASYDIVSLLHIAISLASIYLCWWALQGLKFERFVREPGSPQAKLLHLILAVILGHHFASFLTAYLGWSLFS